MGKVKRLHEYFATHLDAVLNLGRHPDRAVGGNYPVALGGVYPHHSFAGINELMPSMRMKRNLIASLVPHRKSTDWYATVL